MKNVKYFILGLLVCFSFGCTSKTTVESNIKQLQKIVNVEAIECFRFTMFSDFECVALVENNLERFECTESGCQLLKCDNNQFCFQTKFESNSNDTE